MEKANQLYLFRAMPAVEMYGKKRWMHLKGNYQLHVLTLAGFAGVPPIDTPILKTVKNEIIKYVKENHLNKPVLIGHSLGAFMSLWVASEEPSLFSKVFV